MTEPGQSYSATGSMEPEVIGPLFAARFPLVNCSLEGSICVWDWQGGLRLTLDTSKDPPHFHLGMTPRPTGAGPE